MFYSKNGIIHQISCSHMSQQKRVADRKHRHILDVAKTMMIYMHVPKYLWSNVVLSACHLINIMPSSVLRGKVLFSCLYPHKSVLVVPVLFRIYLHVRYTVSSVYKIFFLLSILELRKDIVATVLPTGNILCMLVLRSLNMFHTYLYKVQLLYRNLSLFQVCSIICTCFSS